MAHHLRHSSEMDLVDELDQDAPVQTNPRRPHKLDYYSIPIFILEAIVLAALAFAAYFIHFDYKHKPLVAGFYCDDITIRHQYDRAASVMRHVVRADNELVVLGLLLVAPTVLIIFCELVNSMFGQVRFRRIRAVCTCCKLHSITRRTIRFAGAYALGFFIVVISCNILADTSGVLKPYFAQQCPLAYKSCGVSQNALPARQVRALQESPPPAPSGADDPSNGQPLSRPISSHTTQLSNLTSLSSLTLGPAGQTPSQDVTIKPEALVADDLQAGGADIRSARAPWDRVWVDLSNNDDMLRQACDLSGDLSSPQSRHYEQLFRSWPSFPAAILCYACLYVAVYLSYVGTARPFRIITSVLVMLLVLLATIFGTQLVKEHYNHWEDVAGGAALALAVVLFVLFIYLNQFRDTHYYEKQKMFGPEARAAANSNIYNNNSNAFGQYNFDKHDEQDEHMPNGDTGGSVSNDIAMRYFQIPRANYRGAPRPITSMNQR